MRRGLLLSACLLGAVIPGLMQVQARQTLTGDSQWKAASEVPTGWQKLDFNDSKWPAVKVLGRHGQTGPWRNLAQAGPPTPRRFTVPEGFRVEQIVARPTDRGPFSLVNMTFDARGRLLLSQENGPILLCVEPDQNGLYQKVVDYCTQVKNCQGMCWVRDALDLVGNGPNGTGLYRCRDTQGKDKIDEVKLIHRFKGGMGEHGPHAVLHGPDNFLSLVIGNHAWAQVEKLSPASPLTRWPKGTEGPAPVRPGSTEDILLPYQNDANGHAANIRAPGGTIWRLDYAGQDMALVAAGFPNQFDAAFNPLGELFSYDSDMEWDERDENLPWYRAVKVCHCPPGADFMWRTGSAKTPDYYLDRLPPPLETGRGSPVGVEVYDHPAFPKQYRGALLLADWSIGVIYAVHLTRDGATYKGKLERFCTGSPLNLTDDPAPFRAVLLASTRLSPGNRWHAVELLRYWTAGKSFGADRGKWQEELASWGRWFAQTFPKEPKLPNVAAETVVESKYKFDELLSFLQKEGAKGDSKKGRAVFEKAQCFKCHKYGKEGEGLGPDLTTLSKRFKRVDTLEAIYIHRR